MRQKVNRVLSVISFVYGAILLFFLFSGFARQLVVPRYLPMLGLSAFVLFLFTLFPSSSNPSGLTVFFLALLFLPGLFLSNTTTLMRQRPVSIGGGSFGGSEGKNLAEASADSLADAPFLKKEGSSPIPEEGSIVLDGENYFSFYQELYDHKELFIGREIEVDGFIHSGTGLREGQVLLGRLLMWCCAADAYTVGFLLLNPDLLSVPDPAEAQGRWFHLEGSIVTTEYQNPSTGEVYTVPAISIERAEEIDAPKEGYVYPEW
jgi:putative membrane protein